MKDKNYLIENGVDVEKSLELFGDIEMYNQSIIDFLTDVSSKLDKLRDFKAKGDMANYAIEVHALKSDARYFGFTKLADIAYDQELKSKENNMFYISEHFDELEKETLRALSIVKIYLGQETEDNIQLKQDIKDNVNKDKTILIVDDSEVIKNFIQKLFFNQYEVLIASNGLEALNIINTNISNKKIVGMFLDLNMPEFNGFQVLDYFKENNLFDKIPVSIITGVGSDELVSKAYEYPIISVLRKPFNENDIKRVVEGTVNSFTGN